MYSLWNINCDYSNSCTNLVINFNNSKWCIYYDSTNTTCPTADPSKDPTIYLTNKPTIEPTNNPLYLIKHPTTEPYMDYTINHTQNPSDNPLSATTVLPSKDPTLGPLTIADAADGNNQFLGLEPGVQYMVGGGLIAALLLSIIACTICYVMRINKKTNPKLVKRKRVLTMSDDVDERDNKDASEEEEQEQTTAKPLVMHDGIPALPQETINEGGHTPWMYN